MTPKTVRPTGAFLNSMMLPGITEESPAEDSRMVITRGECWCYSQWVKLHRRGYDSDVARRRAIRLARYIENRWYRSAP